MTNLILFILAILFEGLSSARILVDVSMQQNNPVTFTARQNAIRAGLHGLAYLLSQILMMIFMSYNGYFCASLVLGRSIGFLIFAIILQNPTSLKSTEDLISNATRAEYKKPCCS